MKKKVPIILDLETEGCINVKYDNYLIMWSELLNAIQFYKFDNMELLHTINGIEKSKATDAIIEAASILHYYRWHYWRRMLLMRIITFMSGLLIILLIVILLGAKWWALLIYASISSLQFIPKYDLPDSLKLSVIKSMVLK